MKERKMAMVGKQINLKDTDQTENDLNYWLSRSPQERLQAVTMMVRQNIAVGQRMNRTLTSKRTMK